MPKSRECERQRGGYTIELTPDLKEKHLRQFPEGSPLPELRIIRRASRHAKNVDGYNGWLEQLTELGSQNLYKGHVSSYGEMVLTFVGELDMQRMLRKKRSDLYEPGKRDRLVKYMDKMTGEYNGFARKKGRTITNLVNSLIDVSIIEESIDFDGSKEDTHSNILISQGLEQYDGMRADDIAGLWGHLTLELLPHLEGFGNTKLGAVFTDTDHVQSEMEDTLVWLRSNGLDTNLMQDRTERPHVSVYRMRHSLGLVSIDVPPLPTTLELTAPQMHLNRNSPY